MQIVHMICHSSTVCDTHWIISTGNTYHLFIGIQYRTYMVQKSHKLLLWAGVVKIFVEYILISRGKVTSHQSIDNLPCLHHDVHTGLM